MWAYSFHFKQRIFIVWLQSSFALFMIFKKSFSTLYRAFVQTPVHPFCVISCFKATFLIGCPCKQKIWTTGEKDFCDKPHHQRISEKQNQTFVRSAVRCTGLSNRSTTPALNVPDSGRRFTEFSLPWSGWWLRRQNNVAYDPLPSLNCGEHKVKYKKLLYSIKFW